MPTFFSFEQGSESRSRFPTTDTSPLLGRFRAVPSQPRTTAASSSNRRGSLGLLTRASWRNSVHIGHGYGALISAGLGNNNDGDGDDQDDDDDDLLLLEDESEARWVRWLRRRWRKIDHLWFTPKQSAVLRVARSWWRRWLALVVLPAALAVAWCAIPFPQYPLGDDEDWDGHTKPGGSGGRHKTPGHGEAKVEVNFWFFLAVYYALYNLTALVWITKVFHLYSLNWWPRAVGFPLTIGAIAALAQVGPLALHYVPAARQLTTHNTVWITWTFCIMALPVMIASCLLLSKERHLGLRHSLSATQRIFTSSWWAGEDDDADDVTEIRVHAAARRRAEQAWNLADDDALLQVGGAGGEPPSRVPVRLRGRFLPASFVRFVWFCTALFIGLLAYVIGEAYAEVYLRTLPHSSLDTIVYVYGWISTVYLLDGLTGWILGGNQGERVGSYPLSWVFKLSVLGFSPFPFLSFPLLSFPFPALRGSKLPRPIWRGYIPIYIYIC